MCEINKKKKFLKGITSSKEVGLVLFPFCGEAVQYKYSKQSSFSPLVHSSIIVFVFWLKDFEDYNSF